jgi:hypothetical protein
MDQTSFDASASRRKRRRALIAILLSASLATLGTGAMTLAQFTDSETTTGSWSTGTIILGVSPATTFNATQILPGDSGSQTVTVSNNGTGELRYALSAEVGADPDGLADELDLTVKSGACPGSGTPLYDGAMSGVGGAIFGDPAQGDDPGDRVVASGADDELCLAWSLPLDTGNAFQDTSTSVTFAFDAEQTANNP